ncbi:MAG: hypothetical protein EOP09_19965, partial [Proteobacteria bacterium]
VITGSNGLPHAGNIPGARSGGECVVDNSDNVWLYGGEGFDATASTSTTGLDHLWLYDAALGQWAFKAGHSDCRTDQSDCYPITDGFKRTSEDYLQPGARSNFSLAIDSANRIWLYGGRGFRATGPLYNVTFNDVDTLSDLWVFTNDMWNPVSGNSSITMLPTYGNQGVFDSANAPGGRNSASLIASHDGAGLFLFGGNGFGSHPSNTGRLSDLWYYEISSGDWMHKSGTKDIESTGVYGTKGIASNSNFPGGRENASIWESNDGQIILFGKNIPPFIFAFQ